MGADRQREFSGTDSGGCRVSRNSEYVEPDHERCQSLDSAKKPSTSDYWRLASTRAASQTLGCMSENEPMPCRWRAPSRGQLVGAKEPRAALHGMSNYIFFGALHWSFDNGEGRVLPCLVSGIDELPRGRSAVLQAQVRSLVTPRSRPRASVPASH